MFSPIAAIIETRESTKQYHSDKNKDNKHNRQQQSIFQISENNNNTNKPQFNLKCLKCCFCNNNDLKVSLCPETKDLSYLIKLKLLKTKNSLSIVYQILT